MGRHLERGVESQRRSGWTIEIEIPFRTLNFDPNSDTWGINFQRTVRRKNEDSIWMGWARNQGLRRMTNAGLLTGIQDVTRDTASTSSRTRSAPAIVSRPRRHEVSQTTPRPASTSSTTRRPALRTNLTINTDFAQTEVDQRQVNLTRFSLFFPEKRDFFLDGSTFFDFRQPAQRRPHR